MKLTLTVLLVILSLAVLALIYLLYREKTKTSNSASKEEVQVKKILENEQDGDDEENEIETLPRAFRGDDRWIVTVYPSGCSEKVNCKGNPYSFSVLDLIYHNRNIRIGNNEKCKIILPETVPASVIVTFEQDLGVCYYLKNKRGTAIDIKDKTVITLGNDTVQYDIVFSLEEKAYSGLVFEHDDSESATDSSNIEEISVEEVIKKGKKTFKTGVKRTFKRFKNWLKRNF